MGRGKKVLDLGTNEGLRRLYDDYNLRYFGNRLPKNAVVRFRPVSKAPDLKRDSAYLDQDGERGDRVLEITVDERLRGFDCIVAGLIVHEMAHADVTAGHPRDQHGPRYQKRMLALAKAGALRWIW